VSDVPAEIEFLTVDVVLAMHQRQLDRFGGGEGLRDRGLLESAVAQPQASFGGTYAHDGLFAMAAAYLFHIVSNHPFVDGNKRAGLLAAQAFLDVNGVTLERDSEAFFTLTMAAARAHRRSQAIATPSRRRSSHSTRSCCAGSSRAASARRRCHNEAIIGRDEVQTFATIVRALGPLDAGRCLAHWDAVARTLACQRGGMSREGGEFSSGDYLGPALAGRLRAAGVDAAAAQRLPRALERHAMRSATPFTLARRRSVGWPAASETDLAFLEIVGVDAFDDV